MAEAAGYGQIHGEGRIRVSFGEAVRILWHHFRGKLAEQLQAVLPVVIYLFLFQVFGLRRPIADALAISAALSCVVVGLLFFMEGLRLWLMPVGEAIGHSLPRKSSLATMLGFAFLVGVGATLAEPAMGALRAAGAGIDEKAAPLLGALLNRHTTALAACVGAFVGLAVVLGTLRFLGNWSLKRLLLPVLLLLMGLTLWAHFVPDLKSVIGVCWDFGAVIVGPITVPLVLGLGVGVCKASGRSDTGMSGFGAVTLISLFPILASFALAFVIHYAGPGGPASAAAASEAAIGAGSLASAVFEALVASSQAIVPLSLFLFIVQLVVLRERIVEGDVVALGLCFGLAGLLLFNLGLMQGLTPLGDQVGHVAPGAFSRILIGDPPAAFGPIYGSFWGSIVILAFAFFLGYGATLAEPALNAMGIQVQEITVGAFPKRFLVHAVSFGVGAGMALGVARIVYDLPLAALIVPIYALLLVISMISTEEFVSIAWDSGATTTGPFTVPLVVAMGLGLGKNVPGVVEGFGILSLASAGPVLSVLVVGLILRGAARREAAAAEAPA